MREIRKSRKLDEVCYDIRGPVLNEAQRLEEEGYHIYKLNTGNPYTFGFNAPDELLHDVVINLHDAQGYIDSKGLFAARKAVMQYCQQIGIPGVGIEDIYIGNGVSELIVMAMQGLLDNGDEILIPSPDYPLWTAAATLSGGRAVHYICDEASQWYPDLKDMESKIGPRTRGIVVINPNNPTGSVYPREILEGIAELARKHDLILFSDEIYDKILYDGARHIPLASLAEDLLVVTFNGLSKSYRAAGFRSGWMILSGRMTHAEDYFEGLSMLANMRLCANVPAQFAIQAALGGYQSINDLVIPGGRLREQRDTAHRLLTEIPGISCVLPQGALYLFPKIDTKRFGIVDDMQFILDFLKEKKILMVQGTGFNWAEPDHFRVVFLPRVDELEMVIRSLGDFLGSYRQV